MARMEINIKDNARPCALIEDGTHVLLHGFLEGYAVIEYESGRMALRHPETVRLLDSQDRFSEYFWGDDV